MLLDHCYCPYIRTILKYVHHFANIAYKFIEIKRRDENSFLFIFFKKKGGEFMFKKFFLTVALLKVLYCNAVSKKETVKCNSADVEKSEENRKK